MKDALKNIRYMKFEEESLLFRFSNDRSSTQTEISLPLGYAYVSKRFFKKEMPTESEVEYAINYIEDQLMSNKALIKNDEALIYSDNTLAKLLAKHTDEKKVYSREEYEKLFNHFAYMITGDNFMKQNFNLTNDEFAIMLVLREVLHHLKFTEIKV